MYTQNVFTECLHSVYTECVRTVYVHSVCTQSAFYVVFTRVFAFYIHIIYIRIYLFIYRV